MSIVEKYDQSTTANIAIPAGVPRGGLRFTDISGTIHGHWRPPHDLWGRALGWNRLDLDWGQCQPRPGQWNQEYLSQWGQSILAFRKLGAELLPILDYNTMWSWDRTERTFEHGGKRWHVKPLRGDQLQVTIFQRNARGRWEQAAQTVQKGHWLSGPLAARHVNNWKNYVRRVVSFLRRPPYNVEYFQIWNEAYPTSGYWFGDMGSYFQRVHLPAARIIHELGGKVVYGGWPACGSLQEYVALLDQHDAWRSIDVLDLHYFPLLVFEYLQQVAIKRGRRDMGIWQTEIASNQDPGLISNLYPRLLNWALAHGATKGRDRYKLFYYAYCYVTPDDPNVSAYGKNLYTGTRLAPQGITLRTLGELFGDHPIVAYRDISSDPPLKPELDQRLSSLEAFKVAGRIVAAVHLASSNHSRVFVHGSNHSLNTIHLDYDDLKITLRLPKLVLDKVQKVERWDLAARRTDVTDWLRRGSRGGIEVAVPIRNRLDSPVRRWHWPEQPIYTFYVVFDLAE